VLIVKKDKNSAALFVIQNHNVIFCRTIPFSFVKESEVDRETKGITNFYEAENKIISHILDINDLKIPAFEKTTFKDIEHSGRWLICLGAALRGIIPRDKDTLISLMPISTQEAYEHQKAVTFSEFLANLATGLSVFFIISFALSWVLITTIQENTNKQFDVLKNIPLPPEAATLEAKAKQINNLVTIESKYIKEMPRWSNLIQEIKSRTNDSIIINSLSMPAIDTTIVIAGVAKTRAGLNDFKNSLDASPYLTNIKLPLTNIAQKDNIPFTISFNLKEPQYFMGLKY